jgi:hypothetical protein
MLGALFRLKPLILLEGPFIMKGHESRTTRTTRERVSSVKRQRRLGGSVVDKFLAP